MGRHNKRMAHLLSMQEKIARGREEAATKEISDNGKHH